MGPPPLRDTSFYMVCLLPKGHLQLDLQQCLLAQIPPISPFSPLTSLNVSPPLHCLILRVLSPLHVSPFVSLPQGLPLFPIFAKTPCAPVPGWSYGMQCVGLICFRAGWKCLWLALAQREDSFLGPCGSLRESPCLAAMVLQEPCSHYLGTMRILPAEM